MKPVLAMVAIADSCALVRLLLIQVPRLPAPLQQSQFRETAPAPPGTDVAPLALPEVIEVLARTSEEVLGSLGVNQGEDCAEQAAMPCVSLPGVVRTSCAAFLIRPSW